MWWLWARKVAVASVLAAAPGAVATTATRAEHSPAWTSADPPLPDRPLVRVALLDEDVLRALAERQPSFMRCYRIAQRDDVLLASVQVSLHVKVGATGAVDDATAAGGPAGLDDCITGVARRLTFGAPEQPVETDLKLFFAP